MFMAEVFFDDILEQILVRLDVEDIIQCKSVCKSWYSLISSSRFVNSHLKLNNTIGRRRIVVDGNKLLLGSSNGLVCIFTSDNEICVVNPCTRELKDLQNPRFLQDHYMQLQYRYGFGYDSCSDDYKVIVGKRDYKEKMTSFYLLSLKSNVWKVVGDVKCDLVSDSGILFNGTLHWLIRDQNNYTVILSFDLSKEEFKEIPTPADERFEYTYHTHLGIIEECLCIFDSCERGHPKWVMKNYNDNQSWELLLHLLQWDDDVTHHLKVLKAYYGTKRFFFRDNAYERSLRKQLWWTTLGAPIFVPSLVSPHVNDKRKRKRNGIYSKRNVKINKRDLLVAGSSEKV